MPKMGRRKYPPVTADHLAGRIFPPTAVMAGSVIGAALEQIVPRFGLVESGDSGYGRHFTSQVPQGLMRSSQIRRDFHTPWQPPSSRKVERMSRALKKHPTKLASSHPAQSVSGRTAPRNRRPASLRVTLHLPYSGGTTDLPAMETKDPSLRNCKRAVASADLPQAQRTPCSAPAS